MSSPSPEPAVSSSSPSAPATSEAPPTPEEQVNEQAYVNSWQVDELYGSAAEFVSDMCESLPTSGAGMSTRPQWLAEGGYLEGDGAAILQAGVPKLCPKWTSVVKQAVSGDYERWYSSGTYRVSSKPGTVDDPAIPPGTYRSEGKLEDCYWERTSESGEIIDNNFATSARRITVTIRASDGQFTSERCGVWKPVK